MRTALSTAALVLLAPLVLLWPLPAIRGAAMLAAPDQEAAAHAWGLATALRTGQPVRIQTDLLSWPTGVDVVLVDAANLPWFALGSLGGPALGYNAVLYAGVVLMGVAGALLARQVGGAMPVGAAVAMCSPTLLANAADGQTEGFAVGWAGISLALLLGAVRDAPGRRWPAVLGAALALTASWYGGPYNGVWASLCAVAVGAGAVFGVARRGAGPVLRAGAVGVLGAALTAPLAVAVLTGRQAHLPGSGARAGAWSVVENPSIYRGGVQTGADLLDLWLPVQLTGAEAPVSHTAYLGVVVLVLAVFAVVRSPRRWPWLAGAGAFAALALGPVLYLSGEALRLDGAVLLGPAAALGAIPPLDRLTRWYRAGAMASLLLAPLVALVVARRGAGAQLLVIGLVAADALGLAPLAWPLHHAAPPNASAIAALDGPGALLELPQSTSATPPPGAWRDASPLAQLWHRRPVGGALMGFPPSTEARQAAAAVQRGMRSGELSEAAREDLARSGFGWLAVHPRYMALPADAQARLSSLFGPALHADDDLWLFTLSPQEMEPEAPGGGP